MYRRRQVRLCYPQAFVELALLLARYHGKRDTVRALALPLSTFYRWLERYPQERSNAPETGSHARNERLRNLIAVCEQRGFEVRRSISQLNQARMGASVDEEEGADRRDGMQDLVGIEQTPQATDDDLHLAELTPVENGECMSSAEIALQAKSESELSANVLSRLLLARHEIDSHYYSPLSCEILAEKASMSRFHFIRVFKIAFAISPYQYLMRVRVRQAKHLLGTTHYPLDAIATAVGFESQQSLYRAFKRTEHIGLSSYFRGTRIGSMRRGSND
jgi:AraC-like DNA-binding protein